jgi:hypothetical protein
MYVVKQTSEGLDRSCIDGDEDSDVVVSISPVGRDEERNIPVRETNLQIQSSSRAWRVGTEDERESTPVWEIDHQIQSRRLHLKSG